ncbi:hypothetical protein GE061_002482 [Apolygus lucorum]|uniref:UDP-glucuronosyltransferase n=1 Tax=Apolygus lucorum TaxID=248454 RepID=A0A8S9X573_APOLU|nr:hypothetical protein GE061_002482 [Apolygus lucorum]
MPWKSHHFVFQTIIKELAIRGHQIDYLTPFKIKNAPPNIKHLMVKDTFGEMIGSFNVEEHDPSCGPMNHLGFRKLITNNMKYMFSEDPQIKELLASNETYDIVLGEFNLFQELNTVWIHKFNATAITLLALGDFSFANEFNGLPDNPAYVLDFPSTFTDKMNFVERLINTLDFIGSTALNYYYISLNQGLADELAIYPGWETRPPLARLLSDVALVLVNSHHSVGYAYPKAPHVKEIGGMTLTGSTELPEDLQSFMDTATDGVIYISLGSNVNMNHITKGKIGEFIKGFKSLKQKVLLKWFGDALPDIDDPTIRIQQWFPQLGILAHKNTKVFVMHGGLQSIFESVNSGVPMVGVPIFGDQFKNVKVILSKGMGIELNKRNFTAESLIWSINEVVSNPRYLEAVLKQAAILKDVPMKYLDEAIYWIEYVIRHGKVLQPASVHMPFYQVYLLDVISLIFITILVLCFILIRIVRKVGSMMWKPKKKVE